MASTGGRKAKSIGINKSYCHAMGILITANHIEMVLVNLGDEIIKKDRIRLKIYGRIILLYRGGTKGQKLFLKAKQRRTRYLGLEWRFQELLIRKNGLF